MSEAWASAMRAFAFMVAVGVLGMVAVTIIDLWGKR